MLSYLITAVVSVAAVETAQRLVAYLFSLVDDEELLTLTVSALNGVIECNPRMVLQGLLSSRSRLKEIALEKLATVSEEVGLLSPASHHD